MILIDTNVLVALVDERDGLRARAMSDLGRLEGPCAVLDAVLVETLLLLEQTYLRQRLRFVLERLSAAHAHVEPDWWPGVFDWLEKYARHKPDLCDAMLVAAASQQSCTLWTYDTEFSKIWRTLAGKPLMLVGAAPKARGRRSPLT